MEEKQIKLDDMNASEWIDILDISRKMIDLAMALRSQLIELTRNQQVLFPMEAQYEQFYQCEQKRL